MVEERAVFFIFQIWDGRPGRRDGRYCDLYLPECPVAGCGFGCKLGCRFGWRGTGAMIGWCTPAFVGGHGRRVGCRDALRRRLSIQFRDRAPASPAAGEIEAAAIAAARTCLVAFLLPSFARQAAGAGPRGARPPGLCLCMCVCLVHRGPPNLGFASVPEA